MTLSADLAAAGPPAADPLVETAAALRLATGRLARRMRQESTLGHSLTQLGIMATLDRDGPTTLGELATTEKVAPPTITKAVTTLVDQGVVEKVRDPDDGRVCRARLTEAGDRELRDIRSRRDAWVATRLATLSPDELGVLVEALPILEALSVDPDGPRP